MESGFILLLLIPSPVSCLYVDLSFWLLSFSFSLRNFFYDVPSVWLCLRKSLLCLHFQRVISLDVDWLTDWLFFQYFNCFTPLSSCVCGSWQEAQYDSYQCSSVLMALPCFLWFLSRFHLLSVFLQLEYDILIFWYLYYLVFSELLRSMFGVCH